MPIKFRCRHCQQFLGISRAQAGEITDCPMCGKSIRVPNLDGTIKPIPSPELNLKDSQLVEALGELAEIGKSHSRGEATARPRISETYDATVASPAVEPTVQPKAVPVEPAVPVAQDDSDTIIQGGNDGGTVVEPEDPLRSLAESSTSLPVDRPRRRWASEHRSAWFLGITGAVLAGLLTIVWISNSGDSPPGALEAASGDATQSAKPNEENEGAERPLPGVEHQAARPIGEFASAEGPAVTGRVTYVSDSGDTRPDAGARVLLLPNSKPGTVKLDVAGFLAGAEQLDADVAQAAIRAMGGDLATVADNGDYQLTLNAAGDYHLLAISRHRARDATTSVDSRLQAALSDYFFRPASLLGGLSFQFDQFQYRGQGTSPRDFRFADE